MYKQISRCRICGNTGLIPILHLGQQHLTGVFPRDPAAPLTCGPLELVKCHGDNVCGLVQLHHSYDSGEMYGANYGYRSSLNQSMVQHLKATAEMLTVRAGLTTGDLVLDIGSNDGTSLSFYPATMERVGMDPTIAKFRQYYQPGIVAIPDFFTAARFREHCGSRKARVITSIAMFYDLEEPNRFVEEIARVLADDGLWYFEQSYLLSMLEQNAYDTVCHEHLEYYGLRQIQWLLERNGLEVLEVILNQVNGGSFAILAGKRGSNHRRNQTAIDAVLAAEDRAGLATLEPYRRFEHRVRAHKQDLLEQLGQLRQQGRLVLGYGASTKGNVILQYCGLTAAELPCIAEVNPDKFGSYTPGTRIPIVSEAEAHARKPDQLLVMPWHFRDNLVARENAYLARGGQLIFPLPQIEVVSGSAT